MTGKFLFPSFVKRVVCLTLVLMMVSCLMMTAGCSEKKIELYVINAGSLVLPLADIEEAYEAKYPNVDVLLEGHGSIQVIRQVTELNRLVDIVAVADWSLIPMIMYTTEAESGEPYADWVMRFATNRLGIAYSKDSLYASEIDETNWFEVLQRPDVMMGFSDPRFDSSGYRAFMVLKMAGNHYGAENLFRNLVIDNFRSEITVEENGDVTSIVIPELLQSVSDRIMLRGSSVQLLNLLESREIDYAFEYESVAMQRGLEFIPLPVEIDMSCPELEDVYNQIQVTLDFQRFASVEPVFAGLPIMYGLTIPANAPNREEAERFIRFLIGPEGQAVFARNHQPLLDPPEADIINDVPDTLRDLVK